MAKKTTETRVPAKLIWVGDSLEVVKSFAPEVRKELGEDLRRVQLGEKPRDGRPMKSIGAGVFELRQRDRNGWYRTIYLSITDGKLHVLHSFVKKSARTSKKDLELAGSRLKAVKQKLLEEKKNAKD